MFLNKYQFCLCVVKILREFFLEVGEVYEFRGGLNIVFLYKIIKCWQKYQGLMNGYRVEYVIIQIINKNVSFKFEVNIFVILN